jgi:hypothetical protein
MHPESGMGIEFASRTADERAQVAAFIGFLAAQPGTIPELLITPRALTADGSDTTGSDSEELHDPLLELLRRGESLSQEEFLQELQRQRTSEVTSA